MTVPVLAIVNGQAGGIEAAEARRELKEQITARFPDAEVVFTDGATDVTQIAKAAIVRGTLLLIAGGGDGTINSVASAVAGTHAALGVLPLGTLNHFAKDLNIPVEVAGAMQVLADGHRASVDVAEVNGRLFLNNSGLGLYPTAVHLRDQRRKRGMSKWPAFVWAAFKALLRYRRLRVRVSVDGHHLTRTTPIIFVGNNRYEMEGLRAGKRDTVDGGQLCLYLPLPRGRLHLVWFSVLALFGRAFERDDFEYFFTDTLLIESGQPLLRVSIDGEVVRMKTPLRYRIRPRDLRVIVPRLAAVT